MIEAGLGQRTIVALPSCAGAGPLFVRADHLFSVAPMIRVRADDANGRGGHASIDTQKLVAAAPLIAEIREQHRIRGDFQSAEMRLTLQIKAICRRLTEGDKHEAGRLYGALNSGDHPLATIALAYLAPFLEARERLKQERLRAEKALRKLARSLPVWPWVEAIHGFGALGLAQIVGEAGDLCNYANPAKLWKRMGLAVIEGRAQRRVADAEKALAQGYSPRRRSVMFVIGDSLIKKQNPYRDLYLGRKAYEQAKVPEGTKMLWHRRAQRYVEKRLLRDLWKAWRAA